MRRFTISMFVIILSHFFYGQYFNVLGAMVPYLTQKTGRKQQQWTYLFTLRGIGYLLAGFIQKSQYVAQQDINKKMFIATFVTGIGFSFFSLTTNPSFLGIVIFLTSVGSCSMQILINVLLIMQGKSDPKFYLQFSFCFYGIGAILGPIIIAFLGLNGSLLIGISIFFISFGFLFIPSIEKTNEKEGQNDKLQSLNQFQQYCFAFMIMFYAAITLSIRNWFPSFTVLEEIGTKEQGALSISLYSTTLTIFRFLLLKSTTQTSKALHISSNGTIVIVVGALIAFYCNLKMLMLYGSASLLGIIFSVYYPFVFALPKSFNKTVSSKNSATIMIFYAIGEGILVSIVGYLMEWFDPIMLFFSCLVMMIANKILLIVVIGQLQKDFELKKNLLHDVEMNEVTKK